MKYLLAYNVLSTALNRFHLVQAVQNKYFPEVKQYDRVVVSEKELVLPGFKTVVCEKFGKDGQVCVSAARNAGMRYAKQHGYDYVMLMDIDAVLLEPLRDIAPKRFSPTNNYHSSEQDFISGDYQYLNRDPKLYDGGFYYLHKSLFHLEWFEGFIGHFYEDIDFWFNVLDYDPILPQNLLERHTLIKTLHVYHPQRPDTDPDAVMKNNRIFYNRFMEKYQNYPDFAVRRESLRPFGLI